MIFFIIWIICGLLFSTTVYNTLRKDWYDSLEEDVMKTSAGANVVFMSVATFFLGPIGIIVFPIMFFMGDITPGELVLFWKYPDEEENI